MLHSCWPCYTFCRHVTVLLDTLRFSWIRHTFLGRITPLLEKLHFGKVTVFLDTLGLLDALQFCWTCYVGVGQVTLDLQLMTSANINLQDRLSLILKHPRPNTLDVPLWCLCTTLWRMFRRFGETYSLHLQGEFSIHLKQFIYLEDGSNTFLRYVGILY
jgi:hypothetical protein